jgi:hypothetical protein
MSEEERRQLYAICQVYLAVSDLVGQGDVRERLVDAYMTHLLTLSPDDFPQHLRNEYRGIREALTWLPPSTPVRVSSAPLYPACPRRRPCCWVRSSWLCSTTWRNSDKKRD